MATIRATPTPMASGGVMHESSAHLSASSTLSASATVNPRVHGEIGVSRVMWDVSTTSFGAMLGQAALGQKGVIVGGAAAYVWARRRWPDDANE
jgi:hypothetical protein